MNWRTVLGAVLGAALILPFAWLMGFILYSPTQLTSPNDAKISPVLSDEQRKSLRTYSRRCRTGADCEPPLGCRYDLRFFDYCSDSECMTDRQCPAGHVCRVLTTFKGPWLKQCVLLGDREEGERCYQTPPRTEDACRDGLLCAGEGWCGRPCRLEEPASCPEGFFCADLEPEPACLPTCEARGCPPGQECMRSSQEDVASTCAVVHGDNCQKSPCPDGSWCEDYLIPTRPGEAWVRCAQRCGKPENPPCPSGEVCDVIFCERLCSPEEPGACGVGFHCIQMPAQGPWLCKPEWYQPRE